MTDDLRTAAIVTQAETLRRRGAFSQVEFVEAHIEQLPGRSRRERPRGRRGAWRSSGSCWPCSSSSPPCSASHPVGRFGPFVALSVAASGAPPESAGLGDVDLVAQGLAILALLAWIGAIGAAGGALMRWRDVQ